MDCPYRRLLNSRLQKAVELYTQKAIGCRMILLSAPGCFWLTQDVHMESKSTKNMIFMDSNSIELWYNLTKE